MKAKTRYLSIRYNQIRKKTSPIETIDYSILLTRVFGRPVDSSTAFMYLFRRYGYPVLGWDDYKSLCRYAFTTNDEDVVVKWSMHPGAYHHNLCAFATKQLYSDCEQEKSKPWLDWCAGMTTWVKETHGWLYYNPFTLFHPSAENCGQMEFVGTEEQKQELYDFLYGNHAEMIDRELFKAFCLWKNDGNQKYRNLYATEVKYLPKEPDFHCKYDSQLAASEVQHQYILSMPEDSKIRRVYFAVMALFEDWKRPTYVRDQYFNLAGEESETNLHSECFKADGEEVTDFECGYYEHAGYWFARR